MTGDVSTTNGASSSLSNMSDLNPFIRYIFCYLLTVLNSIWCRLVSYVQFNIFFFQFKISLVLVKHLRYHHIQHHKNILNSFIEKIVLNSHTELYMPRTHTRLTKLLIIFAYLKFFQSFSARKQHLVYIHSIRCPFHTKHTNIVVIIMLYTLIRTYTPQSMGS